MGRGSFRSGRLLPNNWLTVPIRKSLYLKNPSIPRLITMEEISSPRATRLLLHTPISLPCT